MTGLLRDSTRLSVFPAGFAWGAATAAYQIEGSVNSGGRGPSIWDTFSHTPGRTRHGDTGDIACDAYARWESDLDLIASLGLRAYRMSVSWSRLQPGGRGPLNPEAVGHYRRVLDGLRARGIRPFVTLYHWDLPQELEDEGGWPARETALRFADYALGVAQELGDAADDWITVNEPWCSSFLGYGSGKHAPGRTSLPDAVAAAHHLNLASGLAIGAFRAVRPAVRIGPSHILTDLLPGSDRPEDLAATARLDANNNRFFLDPILRGAYSDAVRELYELAGLGTRVHEGDERIAAEPVDFLGINHYHRSLVVADPGELFARARATAAEPATTALGWSVTPRSLADVLLRVAQEAPGLPLYVTENGASFHDYVDPEGEVRDPERVEYLDGYLAAAADAIAAGAPLAGYFAWSLMDNFEWGEGYRERFGLVYVDYRTQARIPKTSAAWYRELISLHAQMVGQDHPHAERAETALPAPDRVGRRTASPD